MQRSMIITGGSSGIGLAIAQKFLANGWYVFNLDIKPWLRGSDAGLNSEFDIAQYEHQAHFVECDVSDYDAVISAVANLPNVEAIDACVSNAGVHFSAKIEDSSEQDFERLININLKSAFSLTKAVLPFMKQSGGAIIYVGSDQSSVAKRNSALYNMTKHGLASLAKTTALDYAEYNIRANIVCPGTIDTPLYQQAIQRYCEQSGADVNEVHAEEAALQPLGRLGKPEEVAALCYFLASEQAEFITGAMLPIDGGYTTA